MWHNYWLQPFEISLLLHEHKSFVLLIRGDELITAEVAII